jgi:ClpP class serine protease
MRGKHIHNATVLALDQEFFTLYMAENSNGADGNSSYHSSLKSFTLTPGSNIQFSYPWSSDPKEGSIALHCIQGIITYNSWWRFSTYDFMQELMAADANPAFVAHLLYIDSPGGEVFGLNEAHNIIKSLTKPVYALVESHCCSAAYYLASAAEKIYVTSPISTVGSIGCMATLCNSREYWEKMGIKDIDIYATKSIRKNKTYMDALDGKVKDYIAKILDPVMALFESNVRGARPDVDESVFEGDSYYAKEALQLGLIDGVKSLEVVAQELQDHVDNIKLASQLSNLI